MPGLSEPLTTHTRLQPCTAAHAGLTDPQMAQERATTSRLAQRLHDQLAQTLTAIRIDFVPEALFANREEARRHARVDRLIDQSLREVRQVLGELRPTLLDEFGLVTAMDSALRARQVVAGPVRLRLEVPPALQGQRWSCDVEYAVFMVAREAVANALRHAQASWVRVSLLGGPKALRLEVLDNGVGLAPGAQQLRPGHLGLLGMRERAASIGADWAVQSPASGGTRVWLDWKEAPA